jgi:hypothetical protein
MKKRKLIGRIGVDSATLWIVDPAYLTEVDADVDEDGNEDVDEDGNGPRRLELNQQMKDHEQFAICLDNFGGDGLFPVYATFEDDGTIRQVIIDFHRG